MYSLIKFHYLLLQKSYLINKLKLRMNFKLQCIFFGILFFILIVLLNEIILNTDSNSIRHKRDLIEVTINDTNINLKNETDNNCKQICLPCNNISIHSNNENRINNKYVGSNLENLCFLKRVGIPLYNGMIQGFKYGAYLRDPMPRKKGFAEKMWLTFGYLSKIYNEFNKRLSI
jgi:hypothetical protein